MRHGFGHAIFVFRTFRGKVCEHHFYVEAWFRIVASDAAYVLGKNDADLSNLDQCDVLLPAKEVEA